MIGLTSAYYLITAKPGEGGMGESVSCAWHALIAKSR